ncbi:hypothetical protein K458DRAFT_394391 [Lentithecium fluviatile CBS 122367]|uniref:Uncharacterized protein n=1 Tax=Lentithecium fluviatile CBS 122367 TaxID=1168545 RepID=A0A6G1IL65_9PLEO|nr:hypothetical protein K458DRAFT_394391 [Lentithecium fluviatile CBS 122367]
MLFRGAAEDDPRVLAAPLMYSEDEINLHRYFLPLALDKTVKQDWKGLSQPRPDTAIGYVTRRDAQSTQPPSATAFTAEEERLLDAFCLTQYLLFPFLTSPWKTPNSNENISHAHNSRPRRCRHSHYSLTCDLHTAQIWVYWGDEEGHHMEMIFEFLLRKENEIVESRGLANIKSALPAFEKSRVRGKGPMVRTGMSTVASSEAESEFRVLPLMTPQSSVSEPMKKRKLAEVYSIWVKDAVIFIRDVFYKLRYLVVLLTGVRSAGELKISKVTRRSSRRKGIDGTRDATDSRLKNMNCGESSAKLAHLFP